MMEDLTISFNIYRVKHTLSVLTDYDTLPYDLAEAMLEVIEKASVNPNLIIEELIQHFNYKVDGEGPTKN